eukprot:773554_1
MASQDLLDLLKQKSNIFNNNYQRFQRKVKSILNEIMKSDCNGEDTKAMYNDRINALFSDYSFAINRLEVEYLTKCKTYLGTVQPLPTTHQNTHYVTHMPNNNRKVRRSKPKTNSAHVQKHNCDNDRPFSCDICHKSFRKKKYVIEHRIQVHTEERHYQCDQCDKSFKLSRRLSHHIRQAHNGYPYECTKCNMKFQMHADFKKHQTGSCTGVSGHTEDRIECVECSKVFESTSALITHQATHDVERPFKCFVAGCIWSFKRKDHLHTHLFKIHNKNPWQCELCSQTFRIRQDLTQHMKSIHWIRHTENSNDNTPNNEKNEVKDKQKINDIGAKEDHLELICNICDESFTSVKPYADHQAMCTQDITMKNNDNIVGIERKDLGSEEVNTASKEMEIVMNKDDDNNQTLYCVCRTQWDDSKGMIQCRFCCEWYHYACVGLLEKGAPFINKYHYYQCVKCQHNDVPPH